MSVLIETSLGDIVVDLHTEAAPLTCKNFLKLCKIKYYNFSCFHRVERGFVAQGGDPAGSGGGGGKSIYGVLGGAPYIPAEIRHELRHAKGTVSMASSGLEDGASGSQFFIALADNLDYLDGKHTVFGRVAEGMDVVDQLSDAICDENKRPLCDILIRHTIILDDPFDDIPGMPQRASSPPIPSASQQAGMRIEVGDQLSVAPTDDERQQRDMAARALTLEMIGDLPYADVKPPENILFVCRLNPATNDDDLTTIFARFGAIASCQVIRDADTDNSLGYAFVEFDEKEACEEAYFKMDNVLIDDRRIRVDFSQSVSRINGRWVRLQKKRNEARTLRPRTKYRSEEAAAPDQFQMVFGGPDEQPAAQTTRRSRSRWDKSDRQRSRSPSPSQRRS
ncbi:Peptidyl-prolyl cis-trans isomerase-like 4 [Coemansia biformis]|uniref:Peptidyl-prolyl cis-trans isomerase n=1 Tax=Coemansia biformis TaxID=1286918 RepID=A0A9W7Y6A9_9FUNG|nr:Peptidyl-prolyl cis-trans isomerase-like 4 [Coemansia biformis]